jgi:hypothetical protein
MAPDASPRSRARPQRAGVCGELPAAQHGFDLFHSPPLELVIDGIEAFAAWVRSTRDAPARRPDAEGPLSGLTAVVLLASALFFAGISTSSAPPRPRSSPSGRPS